MDQEFLCAILVALEDFAKCPNCETCRSSAKEIALIVKAWLETLGITDDRVR